MSEIQGPTPTGTSKPYPTLAQALRHQRVPEENHAFVADIVDAVGISTFIDRGRYIEAVRRGPGPSLHIGKTYTNGFLEGEEVQTRSGALTLRESEGRAGVWYTSHPSTIVLAKPARKTRVAGAPRSTAAPTQRTPKAPVVERDYGVCPDCFMVKNASGSCACD